MTNFLSQFLSTGLGIFSQLLFYFCSFKWLTCWSIFTLIFWFDSTGSITSTVPLAIWRYFLSQQYLNRIQVAIKQPLIPYLFFNSYSFLPCKSNNPLHFSPSPLLQSLLYSSILIHRKENRTWTQGRQKKIHNIFIS